MNTSDTVARTTETHKHTPGPWSVGHVRPQRVHPSLGPMWEAPIHVGQAANRGNCHTIVSGGGPGALHSTEAAVIANARLIAAAPDLLALCREMENWLRPEVEKEPDRTYFWKLVEVIRRVEGKSPLFEVQP